MELKYCKICNEKKPESDFYSTQKSLLCKHHYNLINNQRKKELRKSKKYKDNEKLNYPRTKDSWDSETLFRILNVSPIVPVKTGLISSPRL
jgi:recombinational DNA repair protein (RecF pathway)